MDKCSLKRHCEDSNKGHCKHQPFPHLPHLCGRQESVPEKQHKAMLLSSTQCGGALDSRNKTIREDFFDKVCHSLPTALTHLSVTFVIYKHTASLHHYSTTLTSVPARQQLAQSQRMQEQQLKHDDAIHWKSYQVLSSPGLLIVSWRTPSD